MKIRLIRISLIVLVLLGLTIPNPLLSQTENQISANINETIEELLAGLFFKESVLPGRLEGIGTYFEIKDSEYLNITLKSTKEVKIVLESIPKMISLDIESSQTTSPTNLTFSGLEPNKTYYRYQNSYQNEAVFVTDENGSYSWTQDLSQLHHVWFQEIKGTTFIDKDTVLDHDIIGSIEIIADNVILDCNDHNIIGSGWGFGIYLNNRKNNTVKDCNLYDFSYGIYLFNSSDNALIGNTVSSNYFGIIFDSSSNNNLTDITASLNKYGIWLGSSSNNILQNIIASSNAYDGITLVSSSDNSLADITANSNDLGILIHSSSNNSLTDITVSLNGCGVYLYSYGYLPYPSSDNNVLQGITANSNSWAGITLSSANNNTLSENTVSNNYYGLLYQYSNNNKFYHNNFINNHLFQVWAYRVFDNFFDNGYPLGGNYWSDYNGADEKSGENQDQPGSDGIGDTPYTFTGGQDRYPFMNPNGWGAPVNQPPTISSLNQYKSDGETEIPEGGITTESSPDNPYNSLVVFKANLNDSDNDNVKLQVELKEFNQPFDGTGLIESDFLPSGSTATITRYGIVEGKYHWRARGVDDKGNTSDWQEFGAIGNVDFQVKLVPLYTQVVSPYPSEALTDSWDHLPYAHADPEKGIRYNCGFTIATCGCAITSIVMIARYYDVLEAYSKDVNPKEINDWLKAEPGGYINGDVNWIVGAKYTNWRIKYERSDTTINNYTLLDQKLNQNQPVIAKQINPSHFIVIDNKLANTYGVKDPSWYNTNKLDESTTNWTSKIRDYNNNFYGLRIYKKGDGITQSAITFALGSPAELLLTDPQGRKLGKDAYGIEYNEVPLGWYFEDGFDDPTGENPLFQERNKLIQILEPIDGIYQLQVIGIREGDYSLAFNSYDTQGNVNHQEFHSETAPGYTAQYNINFDSTNSNNTTIELFDKIPPEAEIYFDPLNQEFVIRGTDNTTVNPTISFIPVDKQQVIYFIQDEAGNTTKLFFEKIKQEGKEIKSELKSIQYNDSEIIEFPKTKLKYEWSLDKKTNQIKELEQKIEVEDQFEIKAKYNHQKDETKIKIKRENEEEIKQTVPGLVIIKLITKSGVLDFKF